MSEAKAAATDRDEVYIGGFTSSRLSITGTAAGWRWSGLRYGLYVTNRRIIGVRRGPGPGFGLTLSFTWPLIASFDESRETIEELERKKDIEVYKTQIRSIELTKPRSLAPILLMLAGHFLVYLTSGETVWVDVYGKKEFEKLKEIMNAFSPELVKVIE